LFQSHLLEVAGVATMMTAVLHSASRSALLGLMCGLAAAFILARKVRLSILLSLGTLLALAIFFVDLTAVEDKLGTGGASGIEYRLQKIEMAMEMFYASPVFGKGPGSFTTAAKNSGVRAIMEHTTLESTYPYILAEFGLFGLLCWSASLLLCYRRWRMLPRDKNDIRKVIGNAIIGGIICLLAVQIGENTLFFPKTNWIIGCMLGLLASLRFLPAWHRGGLPAGLAGESSNRTGNIDRPAPDVF
jgi:O-antigen ligase